MKTFSLSIFSLLLSVTVLSQSQDIQWQRCYGGSSVDRLTDLIQASDQTFLFVGSTESSDGDISLNQGESDFWVVKIDMAGDLIWSRTFSGSSEDLASSTILSNAGMYLMAGSTRSFDGDVFGNHGETDIWVVMIDDGGELIWQKSIGGSFFESANCIVSAHDGGFLIAGKTNSNDFDVTDNHGDVDGWIVKLGLSGNILWAKCYGGSSYDDINSIYATSESGYIFAGISTSSDGDISNNYGSNDFWVAKIDSLGEILWSRNYGGIDSDIPYSVVQTYDGGYLITGHTFSNDIDVSGNHGKADLWLLKLDSEGDIEWQRCLGGSENEGAFVVQGYSQDKYLLCGPAQSFDGDVKLNHGMNDFWVLEISNLGNITWSETFGGSNSDTPNACLHTADDGFISAGHSRSNDFDVSGNHGSTDAWVVKLNPDVGINELTQNNPLDIFPNPATDEINCQLSRACPERSRRVNCQLSMSIYDLYGRKQDEIIIPKGQSQTKIDVSAYPSGVYIVVLKDESGIVAWGKFVKR